MFQFKVLHSFQFAFYFILSKMKLVPVSSSEHIVCEFAYVSVFRADFASPIILLSLSLSITSKGRHGP